MSKPRDYVLTFAGAGEQEIKAAGRYLYVLETPSSEVFVSVDSSSELKRGAGQAVFDRDGFKRFTVRSTVAQTVRVMVADDRQDDRRQEVTITGTVAVAPANAGDDGGDTSVGAGATTQVIAGDADRLSVGVHNPAGSAGVVRVGFSAGLTASQGLPLEPGETQFFAYDGAVYVHNPQTSAVTISAAAVKDV